MLSLDAPEGLLCRHQCALKILVASSDFTTKGQRGRTERNVSRLTRVRLHHADTVHEGGVLPLF